MTILLVAKNEGERGGWRDEILVLGDQLIWRRGISAGARKKTRTRLSTLGGRKREAEKDRKSVLGGGKEKESLRSKRGHCEVLDPLGIKSPYTHNQQG